MSGKHATGPHCPVCQTMESDKIINSCWGGSGEPQIIHELFFSASAVQKWAQYMNGWLPSLSYAGVFIHQRPYCEFNPHGFSVVTSTNSHSCRCELGDLLIVFTDNTARRRVATLFQAKMAGGTWPPLRPNPDQWDLYTAWPTFRYTPRSPFSSPGVQVRTLPFSGSHDPAAQYLELDPSPPSVETTLPLTTPSFNVWDRILNRILNGGAGRDFSWDRASAANDWDELIWDLLDYTWHCAMPGNVIAQGSSSSTGDRGVGTFLLQHRDILDVTDGRGPGNTPPSGSGPDDGFGIPVIHLIHGD